MTRLLSTLPPMPSRVRALPIDARGYPVPWFVAWLDDKGQACPRGKGTPDFRVVNPAAISTAVTSKLCWVCGQKRLGLGAFLIGPMCAVNRISSEPPSHVMCADFAARACPFLVNPKQRRREKDLPPGWVEPAGTMVCRNPGVALVWITKSFELVGDGDGGTLFAIGEPDEVRWYAEGRAATRAEVMQSINSGLPILAADALTPGDRAWLASAAQKAQAYLPVEP